MIRLLCLVMLALSCLDRAEAQAGFAPPPAIDAPQSDPAHTQDIATGMQYRLPADFLPRAAAAVRALRAAGITPPDSSNLSLDAMADQVSQIPGVPDILQRSGFDAHSFVLGMTTFGMTFAAQQGRLPSQGSIPSPEPQNMTLLETHHADVQTLIDALGPPPDTAAMPQSGSPPSPLQVR